MNISVKKGMATAGLVGLLSLVLVLGASAFALNALQNSRTSTNTQAYNFDSTSVGPGSGANCRTSATCIKRGTTGPVRGTCVENKCVYDTGTQDNDKYSDMGLKVTKNPLGVTWSGPENPSSTARYVVTIRKEDGTNVSGPREKILDTTIKTVSFSTLTLPAGKYYAQLRYVPKDGQVLKQIKNFTIEN